jgi:hypothetical protein
MHLLAMVDFIIVKSLPAYRHAGFSVTRRRIVITSIKRVIRKEPGAKAGLGVQMRLSSFSLHSWKMSQRGESAIAS